MAVSYTYATLKTAVIDTLEENGAQFAASIDNIIALAETLILRDLNLELFDAVTTGTFTIGNPIVTKPTGFLAVRTFHYTDSNGDFQLVESKSWEFLKDYWPNSALTTAAPRYVTDYSSTEWYLGGTPSVGSTYTVRYIVRPIGLTAVQTTTWLSDNVGDLLFYACLSGSEAFLKDDNRVELWKREYDNRLAAARAELRRERRDEYAPMSGTPDASAQ